MKQNKTKRFLRLQYVCGAPSQDDNHKHVWIVLIIMSDKNVVSSYQKLVGSFFSIGRNVVSPPKEMG